MSIKQQIQNLEAQLKENSEEMEKCIYFVSAEYMGQPDEMKFKPHGKAKYERLVRRNKQIRASLDALWRMPC